MMLMKWICYDVLFLKFRIDGTANKWHFVEFEQIFVPQIWNLIIILFAYTH